MTERGEHGKKIGDAGRTTAGDAGLMTGEASLMHGSGRSRNLPETPGERGLTAGDAGLMIGEEGDRTWEGAYDAGEAGRMTTGEVVLAIRCGFGEHGRWEGGRCIS